MEFIFADDARQDNPSRLGVGPLVAIGGVHVHADAVGALERQIDEHCRDWGFPRAEQFKWSPGSTEPFMRTQLVEDRREGFYEGLIELAISHQVRACVVIEDTKFKTAREQSRDHEHDVTALFLERVSADLRAQTADGTMVVAKPRGGHKEEQKFLSQCLQLLESGTEYEPLANLPLGVFIAQSNRLRLLQLADVVASCVVARVAGEVRYSPRIFEQLKPLFRRDGDRVGGFGVKLHPDFIYANLYHWLLGDSYITRNGFDIPLPDPDSRFGDHPNEPVVMGEIIRSADLQRWKGIAT